MAVREMACRTAIDSATLLRSAQNLDRVGQTQISDELQSQLVESKGPAAIAWQDYEQPEPDFEVRVGQTDETINGKPASQAYVGIADAYLAGGLANSLKSRLFQDASENSGPQELRCLIANVPAYLVQNPSIGLIGAANDATCVALGKAKDLKREKRRPFDSIGS